jgi:capsule polysaccharide export protein KpsE/RkpR
MTAPNLALDFSFLRELPVLKRIAAVAVAFTAAGLLYGILAPKWYRSTLTVVPAKQQRAGISGMLGGELGGLAAGLAESSIGGSADVARIAAVLQSIAVSDAVIEKFALRTRYGEKYQEAAQEELWRHCEVKTLQKPGLVQLSCEDKDPRFVQEMLGYFADYGNQVFRRVGVSSASEEARFLEKRVADLREQAEQTTAQMREFQEEHQIVDLDTQSKAVVSALAALNSQRITKQLELDYARTFSSRGEATLQQLESQLSVMDETVRGLQQDPAALRDGGPSRTSRHRSDRERMFPAALSVPRLRAEFETLYRNRKVAEATLVFALERLESAKASEARDVSTFQVLDPPALPTRRARPKRLLTLLAGTLLGIAVGVAVEWVRDGAAASLLNSVSRSPPTRSRAA